MASRAGDDPAEKPVDVDALLDEIRRRLDEARPEEPGLAEAGPAAPLPEEALERAVELLRRAPTTRPDLRFPGHRSGLSGALVGVFKRSVAATVLLPLRQQLERQARREAAEVTVADEIYRRVVGMEADLRERLERIEARQAMELEGLRRRVAELEGRGGSAAESADADAP